MLRRSLLSLALLASALSSSRGQSLPQLPRATVATGLNDSTLIMVADSARRTRAARALDFRQMLSLRAFDSLVTTNLRITGTCTGCAAGFPLLAPNGTAAAPSYNFANSTGLGLYRVGSDTLGVSTAGVERFWFTASSIKGPNGSATSPTYSWTSSGNDNTGMYMDPPDKIAFSLNGTKLYQLTATQLQLFLTGSAASPVITNSAAGFDDGLWFNGDTVTFTNNGVRSLSVAGGATTFLGGGAGNMTVQAGTGNSRTMTLQTTTSAGAVKNTLVLGADTSTTFLGQIRAGSGASGAPGIAFAAATNMGFYKAGSAMAAQVGGSTVFTFSATQLATGSPVTQMLVPLGDATAPGIAWSNDATTGIYRPAAGTQFAIATAGVSAIRFNAVQQAVFTDGTVARPSVTSTNDTTTGVRFGNAGVMLGSGGVGSFQSSKDSAVFLTGGAGVTTLIVKGGATASLIGGAGNMTILAGTGNARTMTLQSSNSTGTAATFATGSGDTLTFAGHVLGIGNLTTAAGTPGSVCYVTATGQMTKNAATSCVVSSRRFKENIKPLTLGEARSITSKLRPSTFTYIDGKTKAIGLIAEEADSVDRRLASRDERGRVNSVNYEQIAVLLLKVVEDQQRQLDSLKSALRGVTVRKP